jgi:hypothetical protein
MASSSRSAVDDDLANVEFETSEDVDVIPTFDSMGLREDLLRGIYAYGEHKGGREARTRDGEGARGTGKCAGQARRDPFWVDISGIVLRFPFCRGKRLW